MKKRCLIEYLKNENCLWSVKIVRRKRSVGARGSWDENWTLENILINKLASYELLIISMKFNFTTAKNSNRLFTLYTLYFTHFTYYTYLDALTEKHLRIFYTPLTFLPIRGAKNVLNISRINRLHLYSTRVIRFFAIKGEFFPRKKKIDKR